MARPFLAVFLFARVEQYEVLADFRLPVVAVGRVEVGHMVGRVHKRGIAYTPAYVRDRDRSRADQLDPRGTEERHREKTREVETIRRIADVNRKGLDQILASVPIVERPRAVEQRDRRIDGRRRSLVPRDAKPDAGKLDR